MSQRTSACTGSVEDLGIGDGKHYSVNVPLQEGMDDESYRFMFEPIMQKVQSSAQNDTLIWLIVVRMLLNCQTLNKTLNQKAVTDRMPA